MMMHGPIILIVGSFLLFLLGIFVWSMRDVSRIEWQRDEHTDCYNRDHN